MPVDSDTVKAIVEKVLQRLDRGKPAGKDMTPPRSGEASPLQLPESLSGALKSPDAAVEAASKAYEAYRTATLERRRAIIDALRRTALAENERWSCAAVEETGLGRVEDKVAKNRLAAEKTPGVEDLLPTAVSGDRGLTLEELAPWGVIGAIAPCTNPVATVVNNTISMLAGGNAVVFSAHPAAARVTIDCVKHLNAAVVSADGPANLIATMENASIEAAQALMKHPGVALLVVTGGPAVVRAAFACGKKVIAAGPGNPPAVVDEKEIICVESVAGELKAELVKAGAFELSRKDWARLAETALAAPGSPSEEGTANRTYVGKDAGVLLTAIGMDGPAPRLLFADVSADDPFVWTEQLMPAVPLVRVRSADEAIEFARRVEGGRRHTAVMHSRNIEKLSAMARAMDCSIFVKNGTGVAGIGQGGEGHTSFTIAGPTGEGVTSARSFVRRRRCVLVDYFRIV